jgi:hypothetical protein
MLLAGQRLAPASSGPPHSLESAVCVCLCVGVCMYVSECVCWRVYVRECMELGANVFVVSLNALDIL